MTGHETIQKKRAVLREVFGFESFRPGQEAVVDAILSGHSILAVMPTGSGKSLCYQVPALIFDGLTIVVSPLVALMQDQVAALRLAGVAAEAINSSHERGDNVAAWRRVSAGETRLLYLAPERLMTEPMLAALGRLPLRLLVVDEAHCISQWGPAFRPDYADLVQLKTRFPGTPIAALTATADATTRDDIAEKLFAGDGKIFVAGFDRPNIHLSVEMKQRWKHQLMNFLQSHQGESGIVYCLSRKKTEATATYLRDNGVKALPYHAGMEKSRRAENQNRFLAEAGTVMVATIAFGMGIDKPDVRFVFHADIPGSIESYYQEIGRAGRDGRPAEARMLYGLGDMALRRHFIEQEDSDADRKRREHKRLDALIGYCESPRCRRRALLAYFGDTDTNKPCGNCDLCQNPIQLVDGTQEAQKVLSAVMGTGQRFGAAHIIDVLRGARTEKITRGGHHNLPSFAIGPEHGKDLWRSIIRQLVAAGFLHLDIQGYGGIRLTESGQDLLRGEKSFRYRIDTLARSAGKKKLPQEKLPRKKLTRRQTFDLSDRDGALFDQLKVLRLRLAQARGVPAYVIFSDRSLEDMAKHRPRSRMAFAKVQGVGEVKLRELADAFLAAIAEEKSPISGADDYGPGDSGPGEAGGGRAEAGA